jgi:hypothetical protein
VSSGSNFWEKSTHSVSQQYPFVEKSSLNFEMTGRDGNSSRRSLPKANLSDYNQMGAYFYHFMDSIGLTSLSFKEEEKKERQSY